MRLPRKDKTAGNLTRAQQLRADQSPAEGVLWGFLRAHRLAGFKFKRQVAMGPWVADFYCAEASLVVELDGESHRGDRKDLDRHRDTWMHTRGIFVLRVTASELSKNPDGVRATILRLCRERTPPPSPLSPTAIRERAGERARLLPPPPHLDNPTARHAHEPRRSE